MRLQQAEKNLIHRFLNNELSGIDLESFNERMERDADFKEEVNFYHLLRSGILSSKEDELIKLVVEKIHFKKAAIPFALKLIFTFLLITGIGIMLWFYTGTDSSNPRKGYTFFPFNLKEKHKKANRKSVELKNDIGNEDSLQTIKDNVSSDGDHESEDRQIASEKADGMTGNEQNQSASIDSAAMINDEDKDIVIKKEQLLISTMIPVIEKPSADLLPGSSLAHDAAEKLNPSAGIPNEEKSASNYQVEFWISPINYRGYKMSKNKLILYGIEEPDAVKLFRLNDILIMKYGNEYYKLVSTFDFLSYKRLKDTEVPLTIRQ